MNFAKRFTKRWNINRGYMKLDVWQKAIDLNKLIWEYTHNRTTIDFKLRSQINDSAVSVPSNIAEGYNRRSIKDYIRFLYIALSSLSETLTRAIALLNTDVFTDKQFEGLDKLHYEVENKLLKLIESLEKKRDKSEWTDRIHDTIDELNADE